MALLAPKKFIDRDVEQEIFDELLKLNNAARLLTICDQGGRGKSALLKRLRYNCQWRSEPQRPVSLVELDRLPDNQPFTLVHTLVKDLKEFDVAFPRFSENNNARVRKDFRFFEASRSSIEGKAYLQNTSIGGTATEISGVSIKNEGQVVVNQVSGWVDKGQEDIAREACIEAFFADLHEICAETPVVVLLDSWEQCNSDLEEWLLQRVLHRQCFQENKRPAKFVVVLAGRGLPDFQDMLGAERFTRLIKSIEALGDWEEKHVQEFLALHGYSEVDETEVKLLCDKLRGGWTMDKALETFKQFRAA